MAKKSTKVTGISGIAFSGDRRKFWIKFRRENGGIAEIECPAPVLDDLILQLQDVEEKAFLHDPTSGAIQDEPEKFRFEEIEEVSTSFGNLDGEPTFFLGLKITKGFTRWFALPASYMEELSKRILDTPRVNTGRDSH